MSWRLAALWNGFQDATAYRIEFLFEVLGGAAVPAAIQWVIWYAMFKIGGQSQVGGMSYPEMVHYTLVSILFTQVRGGDHDFELVEMIRSGQLSNYLLRPVGVVEFVWIRGVAPKLFLAGLCLAVGIVAGLMIDMSPGRMVLSMGLALMGNVIHYQIGAALGTMAFYWEEAYSILMVKNMLVSFLSGELLPLNLFPQSMQWMWKATPFYLYVYAPTQFALGNETPLQFGQQCLIGLAWIAFGWIAIRVSWGIGIRRYLSLGG